MKIRKIFNNNVILLSDEMGNEMIVMGKGIGFNKHNSEEVDFSKVDKRFVIDKGQTNKLTELIEHINIEYLELTKDIIDYAENKLAVSFNQNIYLTLTDHISFAITRYQEGIDIRNPLLWEIKKFHKDEYLVASEALKIIEKRLHIALPTEEAAAIALHFVNAQQSGSDMKQTIEVTKIVNDLINIVKYHYGIKLDENSINFSRFMTHLRYFAYRILSKEAIPNENDSLFEQIKNRYPKAYSCAQKMVTYLEKNDRIIPTDEELVYLIIHIHRVTNRSTNIL
ncbi:PRD domain-containing protein [Bacillus safensis]|uniref:BglG family transcription antiterminator LicT n=1 Tax=Bacillus safensis TaxID=561879 RepID=UPI00203E6EEC|nr:PRD domain-containing protein [Bacillus safensis]MCM2989900.1 PRD domain-containing protein [Bacillus safensis]